MHCFSPTFHHTLPRKSCEQVIPTTARMMCSSNYPLSLRVSVFFIIVLPPEKTQSGESEKQGDALVLNFFLQLAPRPAPVSCPS